MLKIVPVLFSLLFLFTSNFLFAEKLCNESFTDENISKMNSKNIVFNQKFSVASNVNSESAYAYFLNGVQLTGEEFRKKRNGNGCMIYISKSAKKGDAVDYKFSNKTVGKITDGTVFKSKVYIYFATTKLNDGSVFNIDCDSNSSISYVISPSSIQKELGKYLTFPCFTHSTEEANLNKKDPTADAEVSTKQLPSKEKIKLQKEKSDASGQKNI